MESKPLNLLKLSAICLLPFLLSAGEAGGEGWENIDPDRRDPPPGKVLWRADLSQGADGFVLEKADGAEGHVFFDGGNLRIVKANDRGYLVLRPKCPLRPPRLSRHRLLSLPLRLSKHRRRS